MPRSSESVAALASALAKAQAELINPEKSLTATIRTGRPGEGERSFRYAPLSSGLDIVRKTLGQHEIATLQTTAIDQTAGMVNLTTMLAHASGEWIASDWPVCPIAETANPQRMGAALTYARRYALFTLVGIAGEDDLDAPDLCDGPRSSTPSADERSLMPRDGQQQRESLAMDRFAAALMASAPRTLEPEQSAALRDKLLTALGNITSADSAAIWAQETLAAKNRLASTDAKLVEDAFERRLSELPSSNAVTRPNDASSVAQIAGPRRSLPAKAPTLVKRTASTRASSRSRPRGAIATGSICATSPNRRVSYAAASPRIPTTSDLPSRARLAARSAMSSRSRSVGGITARCIAHATSAPGGSRPASTPSRLPAGCGKRRAEWERDGLNRRCHLGRMAPPRLLIHGTRT